MVKLFGVKSNCPVFTEGKVALITSKINKTAIEHAGCSSTQNNVTFDITDRNNKTFTLCTAVSVCKPAQDPSPGTCCCEDADQDKVCKYAHKPNRSRDEGARIETKFCIDPQHYLDVKDESCRNLHLDTGKSGASMPNVETPWVAAVCFGTLYVSVKLQQL